MLLLYHFLAYFRKNENTVFSHNSKQEVAIYEKEKLSY